MPAVVWRFPPPFLIVLCIYPFGILTNVFPLGCDNAQLVSALNNEDQGTTNIGNNLFLLPADLVNAAFGYSNVDNNATQAAMPGVGTGSTWGTKECLARCAAYNKTRRAA